jgi:hypothetical protein
LSRRLSGLASASDPSASAVSEARRRYREAAAVLSYFDPLTLKTAEGDSSPSEARRQLVDDIPPGTESEELWILSGPIRKVALAQLTQEEMRRLLELNPPTSNDAHQRALAAYINDDPPTLANLSFEDLHATATVVDWLRDRVPTVPSRGELRRRLDRAELLQPFRRLAGPGCFFGRGRHVESIKAYVADSATSLYDKPPLFIHGPGGIGKSALLARAILEMDGGAEAPGRAFAYIDFDLEGALDEPLHLLIRSAPRQIARQGGDTADDWRVLTTHWSDRVSSASHAAGEEAAVLTPRERGELLRQFRGNLGPPDRAFVLILDSFAEGDARRSAFVDRLWRLLNELQALHPRTRVIISGREPPATFTVVDMPLGGLGTAEAEELLEALKVHVPDDVGRIVDQLDGHPHNLRLAAELLSRDGRLDMALLPTKDVLQGTLYRRVLSEIQDGEVRRLALYSFVLRHLTRDLLADVLAEGCGIKVHGSEQAKRLFEDVGRRLLLAKTGSDASLHHSPDVRRPLLEFLRQEDPERVDAIHARAVAYFARGTDAGSRAEELYHRLCLGEQPRLPGSQESAQSLQATVGELPLAGQKYLAGLLGFTLDPRSLARAELIERERSTEQEVRALLAEGRSDEALRRLGERRERLPGSPLFRLHANVHKSLGDADAARRIVEDGLRSAAPLGDGPVAVDLLLLLAELDSEPAARARTLENAYVVARRLQDVDRTIEAGLAWLLAARASPPGPVLSDLQGELRGTFMQMPDARVTRRGPSMHRLAAMIGGQYPDVLERVIRTAGLPNPLGESAMADLEELFAEIGPTDDAPRGEVATADEWHRILSDRQPPQLDHMVLALVSGDAATVAAPRVAAIFAKALNIRDGSAKTNASRLSGITPHPIFDAPRYPHARDDAKAFYKALYAAISEPSRIDTLYRQAGGEEPLNPRMPVVEIWSDALDKLIRARRLEELCRIVLGDSMLAALHVHARALIDARPS